jgi:hypothetical protein
MPKTFLTVATRKGTFVLESDDRRDWALRGPYCEGWPVYHSIYDPNTGSIFAAAASEWHGSAIWRSRDLGETWEHSSEGLSYGDDDGRRISKVSTLALALETMLGRATADGVERIALPRIGAGKGGIDRVRVKKVLTEAGKKTPISLVVFEQFVRTKAEPTPPPA